MTPAEWLAGRPCCSWCSTPIFDLCEELCWECYDRAQAFDFLDETDSDERTTT